MIKSTFTPAFLFAELHSRLWGTFTIFLMPDIACFAFTCYVSRNPHRLGLSSYPQFTYETMKLNTCNLENSY